MDGSKTPLQLCPACHIGHLREERSTYTHWHKEQLIVVPNVPAQVCDYCGETHFHPVVLERLRQLLSAEAGSKTREGLSRKSRPGRSPSRDPKTLRFDP